LALAVGSHLAFLALLALATFLAFFALLAGLALLLAFAFLRGLGAAVFLVSLVLSLAWLLALVVLSGLVFGFFAGTLTLLPFRLFASFTALFPLTTPRHLRIGLLALLALTFLAFAFRRFTGRGRPCSLGFVFAGLDAFASIGRVAVGLARLVGRV
jgi:hypothetical protein